MNVVAIFFMVGYSGCSGGLQSETLAYLIVEEEFQPNHRVALKVVSPCLLSTPLP